jgi:hypothetical protein
MENEEQQQEWVVRAVDFEEKSPAEIEREVVQMYDEQPETQEETLEEAVQEEVQEEIVSNELDDNTVLSHIKNKYGREVNSLEDLFKEQQAPEELPEDVSTYLKYKKETGRSFEDFIKLNKDFDKEDPNKLLAEYLKEKNPYLDDEDIKFKLEEYQFDEDLDTEKEIRAKKLALKEDLSKAKEYFNNLKEQYKVPLESRDTFVPQEEKEEYNAFKEYKKTVTSQTELQQRQSEVFVEKTSNLFSDKFEGFGFNLDENNKVTYKPSDASTLKEKQSNLGEFIKGFLDDNGFLKDAEEFHKAIAVAREPEKFAKFFYEKGKADQAVELEKDSKNIDMVRNSHTSINTDGPKIRALDDSVGTGLRFKKR